MFDMKLGDKTITEPYIIIAPSERDGGPIKENCGIRFQRFIDLVIKRAIQNRENVVLKAKVSILIFNPLYNVDNLPSEVKQWIKDEDIEIYTDAYIPLDYYKCGLHRIVRKNDS